MFLELILPSKKTYKIMKKNIFYLLFIMYIMLITSCANLDIQPLSNGSSENWYQSDEEIVMSLNDLYRPNFFPIDDRDWDDDVMNRNGSNEILAGTMTSQSGYASERWNTMYKGISRALKILEALHNGKISGISDANIKQYTGEAYFVIGFEYAELATYFGDAVLYKNSMPLDWLYNATRSPKREVLDYAYNCLDSAAMLLPEKYSGIQRATKGAALGFKARFALFHGDYAVAAKACEDCMALNAYSLHPTYSGLFTADSSPELMFYFKCDIELKFSVSWFSTIKDVVLRKIGGFANHSPSYQLMCSYLCTDGLPIDESQLYNPKDPFENRDPRMSVTIQPFKTKNAKDYAEYEQSKVDGTFPNKYPQYILDGYEYAPGPYSTKVYEVKSGNMVTNSDSKAANEHAAYDGLMIKKYSKDNWVNYANYNNQSDNIFPYLRYAEILMTYVEAKNELGECTQDILDKTINKVRERAYAGSGLKYPRVIMDSQAHLRKIIRMERRMEFPFEGIRYRDLLRWRIAEKTFNIPQYYLPRVWSSSAYWNGSVENSNITLSNGFKTLLKNWDDGNYPIGGIPKIDDNGIPDISYMEDAGYISRFYMMQFDATKNYLWPIPAADILTNSKLKQNPGY
jgi:hypothetical protein